MGNDTNIGIIGTGRLGKALGLCLHSHNYRVVAGMSQSHKSAEWLAKRIPHSKALKSPQEIADSSDLIFITTPDSSIGAITDSVKWSSHHSVIQCGGATSISVLQSAQRFGSATATFHPYQTFSQNIDENNIHCLLHDSTITITSDNLSLLEHLWSIAENIGARPVVLQDEQRPLYHASAVLSCGALTALLSLSLEIWRSLGFSESEALKAIGHLAQTTLNNVQTNGILNSMTGPTTRNDLETLKLHFEALLPFSKNGAAVYSLLNLVATSINEPSQNHMQSSPAAQLIENEFIKRLFP